MLKSCQIELLLLTLRSNKNNIMANHRLDALDRKILKLISADARIPFLEVARACNVSGAAIHQRIDRKSVV